jgi:F-type H+-transporting ATPase subunit epsilon
MADSFQLTLLLPDQIVLSTPVTRVGGEAVNGSFVVLPRHIDFVTALVPGILYYLDDNDDDHPHYAAIDRGILVKRNGTVWVSVLQAMLGDDLEHLDQVVEQEFRQLSEQQKQTQTALTRLELSFMRGLVDLGKAGRRG